MYSTGVGRVCPDCGQPAGLCRCRRSGSESPSPSPNRPTVRLRIETKGRGGKTVTVVDGLPRDVSSLRTLAAELKRACGTGGAVRDGRMELQGDRRDALRTLLGAEGYTVKG